MANRLKIDYGIDLGTTNSAIFRMEKGEAKVIKVEVTDDTMPSCVYFNKRQGVVVGKSAYHSMKSDKRKATKKWKDNSTNTYIEFKRKMGTDEKFTSSNMGKDFSAEELSAEVLKSLKSFVQDEVVRSVVITVPAKFTTSQKDATMRAAKLAGFEHCELLQEPIAAAMAYGLKSTEKNGYWMVFDFGGGTFDAAMLKVEDGIMQVFDTEGDNYLGGKNLDYAIVDELIIPYIEENFVIDDILADKKKKEVLREAMKTYAEEAKNALSFKPEYTIVTDLGDLGEDDEGTELELDLTITAEDLKRVFTPIIQKAVDICLRLLERNNMTGSQLNKVILVGGPTHSPILRDMLREQVSEKVDTSIDPMTAVANGAALYAATIDNEVKKQVEAGTVALSLNYEATSVEDVEFVTIKLDRELSTGNLPDKLTAKFTRADNAWDSGTIELTEQGDVVDCALVESRPNIFNIEVFDGQGNRIPCTPTEFTIIQGSKVGNAVLPYNIGLEVWDAEDNVAGLKPIKGLEKNQSMPAVGVANGLKTTCDIRPGMESDQMKFPLYEGDSEVSENADKLLPAVLFEHIYTAVLTGENIPSLLPEGSTVDLTVKVDRSGTVTLSVYIPSLDYTEEIAVPRDTVQKTVSDEYLKGEISKAKAQAVRLELEGAETEEISEGIDNVARQLENGDEKKQVLQNLKEQMRKLAVMDKDGEWGRLEKKLRSAFKMLEEDNTKYGNEKTTQIVEEIRKRVDETIHNKNKANAKILIDDMGALNFQLAKFDYYVAWIADWNHRFSSFHWKDATRARQLLDTGLHIIADAPTADKLQPVVRELINLIPKNEMPEGAGGLLRG